MKFFLFVTVVVGIFCTLNAEEETKKSVEQKETTSSTLDKLAIDTENMDQVRSKKSPSDCVQFQDRQSGKVFVQCAENSAPPQDVPRQMQISTFDLQRAAAENQFLQAPQPGGRAYGGYGSAPAPAPSSYGSSSSYSAPAPSYAPAPAPSYKPAPAPSYGPPPAPSYPGPAKPYSYQATFAPQQCGQNLLFSCQPSVAPVPCQAPPPSYSAPAPAPYSAPAPAPYSAPAPSYKDASANIDGMSGTFDF